MTNILSREDYAEHVDIDNYEDWAFEALVYRLLPDGRWQYKSFDTGYYWETMSLSQLPDMGKCRCSDAQFVHYEVIDRQRVHINCPHCIKEASE